MHLPTDKSLVCFKPRLSLVVLFFEYVPTFGSQMGGPRHGS